MPFPGIPEHGRGVPGCLWMDHSPVPLLLTGNVSHSTGNVFLQHWEFQRHWECVPAALGIPVPLGMNSSTTGNVFPQHWEF